MSLSNTLIYHFQPADGLVSLLHFIGQFFAGYCLLIVLLVQMAKMQSQGCSAMANWPYYTSSSTWDPHGAILTDWRSPEGHLQLSRKVIHKENSEADAFLTPENGCGCHFT
ncbi:uncharacterized protein LOC108707216 [Xenopus laevis]|uniref:Uncharacterized protein LOC108707216 n=1 Tax=Xenopus laevis TaxID=8355 RepID=A0A8J1M3V1_XENLA|nr:uncharacterized protein LOC108707216 [Xenopus laevis]